MEGCDTEDGETFTICRCTHLTTFTILSVHMYMYTFVYNIFCECMTLQCLYIQ